MRGVEDLSGGDRLVRSEFDLRFAIIDLCEIWLLTCCADLHSNNVDQIPIAISENPSRPPCRSPPAPLTLTSAALGLLLLLLLLNLGGLGSAMSRGESMPR